MLSVILAAVLSAGGSGGTGVPTQPFFFPAYYVASVPGVDPGVHFSGFDAPDDKEVTITKLLWNSWGAAGTGTARFEVLDSGGSVVCFVDVDCADAAGQDTRADCASSFVVPIGEHINLQANATNTCEPSGMLQVIGHM